MSPYSQARTDRTTSLLQRASTDNGDGPFRCLNFFQKLAELDEASLERLSVVSCPAIANRHGRHLFIGKDQVRTAHDLQARRYGSSYASFSKSL